MYILERQKDEAGRFGPISKANMKKKIGGGGGRAVANCSFCPGGEIREIMRVEGDKRRDEKKDYKQEKNFPLEDVGGKRERAPKRSRIDISSL